MLSFRRLLPPGDVVENVTDGQPSGKKRIAAMRYPGSDNHFYARHAGGALWNILLNATLDYEKVKRLALRTSLDYDYKAKRTQASYSQQK